MCTKFNTKFIGTGIKALDDLLGGGIRKGYIVEFAGYPWSIVKNMLHLTLVNIVLEGYDVTLIYHQGFEGLDPYYINRLLRLHNIPLSTFERSVRIRRGFKPEDYIAGLRKLKSELIILVDPFRVVMEFPEYNSVYRVLRRLMSKGSTIIIYNRVDHRGRIYGGNLHKHMVHYIVVIRLIKEFIEVSMVKSIDLPCTSFYIPIETLSTLGREFKQFKLCDWVV